MNPRSQVSNRKWTSGFTLIELLVVITIITVLLAILIPAIESARMQAKLALCGTNHKALGGAALAYALQNENFYPNRDYGNLFDGDPLMVRWVKGSLAFDLRAKYQPYTSLNAFSDPLMGGPKINAVNDPNDPNLLPTASPNLMGEYAIYAGLQWTRWGLDPMERVGQRFEAENINGSKLQSSVVTADWNMYRLSGTPRSGHPDTSTPPILRPRYYTYPADPDNNSIIHFSAWIAGAGNYSRPTTLNFGYSDGSVIRFNDVMGPGPFSPYPARWIASKEEPRMFLSRATYVHKPRDTADYPTTFQEIAGSATASMYFQLPRQ